MRTHKTSERGASLVEMALILPLLVLILVGVADLGRAFHDYIVIHNASREGARYASRFYNDASGIRQAVTNEALNSGVTVLDSNIHISPTHTVVISTTNGTPITVTVQHGFRSILTRIVGWDIITMTARTEMVVFGYD